MSAVRILAVMGSGETSPTMVSVHQDLFARLGDGRVPSLVLDTPVGFQENADEIVRKAVQYFAHSVGRQVDVASYRSADVPALEAETFAVRLREARWVFAGPGSPSYALRQWRRSAVPDELRAKLREGGCVVFSSAAACALGRFALPVYEIYKVGEEVRWLDGLDLVSEAGLDAAVIPHFNNAEGGTHDTRYCYMGERRLRVLEDMLPDGAVILGVDEHTACLIDLGAGTVEVRGRGVVTLRRRGRVARFEAGTTIPLERFRATERAPSAPAGAGRGGAAGAESRAAAAATASGGATEPGDVAAAGESAATEDPAAPPAGGDPMAESVAERRTRFDAALAGGDVDGMLAAVLELDDVLWAWSSDTLDSDAMDRGRAELRGLLVRLADVARTGTHDPREAVAPLIDAVLELRGQAREERRWTDADRLRDALVQLGVEVHDTGSGSSWELPPGFGRDGEGAGPEPRTRQP